MPENIEEATSLLVRGGRVVDPATGTDGPMDVLIVAGAIAAVGRGLSPAPGGRTVDASGLVVVPGLIDLHVHLREPGFEDKETIATGLRAAVRGGFTAVCAMPNTAPVNDSPATTAWIMARAKRAGLARVFPIAAVTKGSRGEELVDMAACAAAGAVAFSDDGRPVASDDIMRRALLAAAAAGSLVIDHCEDRALAAGGVMHAGAAAARLGLPGIPSSSEEVAVARDIALAEELGVRVHIAHLSTAGGVAAVREARRRGIRVSAEATPHHLFLTDEDIRTPDPNFKMNPPLRTAADAAALREGLRAGVVDAVATDHAPHTEAEKARGFREAPFGVVGLETAVPLVLDRLVRPGLLPLGRAVAALSTAPARLLGLRAKGRVAAGADGDLTLLDLERDAAVDKTRFESKGRNTPFDGWALKGAPVMTIVGGRVVFPFDGGGRP
ncbi:MAG TPA: dihydroorotase [Candidatus Aminicenantes bacterium]|nr:dihydroorotase [Candidatus Aminicenantes bacterium]